MSSDEHPAYDWWADQTSQLVSMDEILRGDADDADVDEGEQLLTMIEEDRVLSWVDEAELVTTLASLSVPIDQTAEALGISETEAEALAEQRAIMIGERIEAIEEDRESRL